jgi:sigma-B regulation protein RsbU (phosphoserine phosphatase)
VVTAVNGRDALEKIAAEPFDMVLLDLIMPELDGFQVLQRLKADPAHRHLPVIMISALDELDSVIRCIESGAEDYLPKPFNPTLLRARISACLEKKAMRDAEQRYLQTIEETKNRLDGELAEAAHYVRSILPEPSEAPLPIDWKYTPSTELGGDAFGYHWIDDEHFGRSLHTERFGHGLVLILQNRELDVEFGGFLLNSRHVVLDEGVEHQKLDVLVLVGLGDLLVLGH